MRSFFTAGSALTGAVVLRFLREGLVVRALLWPGLVCALVLVGTAGGYAIWGASPTVVVSDVGLAQRLAVDGFAVEVGKDPAAQLASGAAVRGIWKEGDSWVLGRVWGGRGTHRIEAALRDIVGAPWRIDIPPLEARPTDVDYQAHLMAGVIGLFFTLYGVVMGAGSVFRDRGNGCLESELSLPLPTWTHGAARILALTLVLVPALVTSLLALHGLLGIDSVGEWMLQDCLAAVSGGALGLVATSGSAADKGFSAPLSRALTAAMAMIGLGWAWPGLGSSLPLASLGAFLAGSAPTALVLPAALAVSAAAAMRFGRSECL